MSRRPRIHYPGAWYHVILRGNGGQDIFFSILDRLRFFRLLEEGAERFGHTIHCYCLMTNHVHLVVQVGSTPLSKIIQNLSFRYTRYINDRLGQTGHLFQGRYKALLIDADSYLLELVRYIHNNPVRGGLAETADDYPWSSHHSYSGGIFAPWLSIERVLASFSHTQTRASELYREFMGAADSLQRGFDNQTGSGQAHILGDEFFAEEVAKKVPISTNSRLTMDQVLDGVCSFFSVSLQELSGSSRISGIAEARSAAAYLVREADRLTLVELGQKLNRESSGLTKMAVRFEKKHRKGSNFIQILEHHVGSGLKN